LENPIASITTSPFHRQTDRPRPETQPRKRVGHKASTRETIFASRGVLPHVDDGHNVLVQLLTARGAASKVCPAQFRDNQDGGGSG
jgi:hypothetical protein